jgi:hypothetical protein
MKNIDIVALQTRINAMMPVLNEYQLRRFLSAEARAIGYGGISLVSRLSGVSRPTLTEGVKELDNPEAEIMPQGRSRKPGAGRKPVWEKYPGIMSELESLVSIHTKGDPERTLLHTNKSLRKLSKGLESKGYSIMV